MRFLGYDPGGKGTHGVAAIQVSEVGEILGDPLCEVVEDAEAAWTWLSSYTDAQALGIDTLLAWSPSGSRECDNVLRRKYREHAPTVIPQNALYSSMTLNGAMVARRAADRSLLLFESHPKLLVKVLPVTDPASADILKTYTALKAAGEGVRKAAKQADDKADAVVAAWCAAQGHSGRWVTDLFKTSGGRLENVADRVKYPWFEVL